MIPNFDKARNVYVLPCSDCGAVVDLNCDSEGYELIDKQGDMCGDEVWCADCTDKAWLARQAAS